MADIAFLGIGNMGFGMALRLLEAGHRVHAFNRTQSKVLRLVEKGAIPAETPRQAAEGADAIISMVGDDAASRTVWLGKDGALSAGPAKHAIMIECSTLSHDWVIQLSAIVKEGNYSYLDCPVTGLPEAARAGDLTLFLGGDRKVISTAQPFLTPLATKQIHFGEIGAGTAYKLIVNLMGAIQIAALAEGLVVAEKAGLDLDLVAEALGSGGAGSPHVRRISKQMAAAEHENKVDFNAGWRLKDTKYGVAFARKMGQEAILGKNAEEIFQRVVQAGYSHLSESKVIDILRK